MPNNNEIQVQNEPFSKPLFTRWQRFPTILGADLDGVFINRTAPYPSEQKAQESDTWFQDRIKTNKLTVRSYGYFQLFICVLRMENFDSREEFDDIFIDPEDRIEPEFKDKLSIEDALKSMWTWIIVNRNYFLENEDELEKLLGRRVGRECLAIKENEDENEDENERPSLVCQEIFYKLMVELFGEPTADESDDRDEKQEGVFEKALMVREFRKLYFDGNFSKTTARRGNYYILFSHCCWIQLIEQEAELMRLWFI